MRRTTLDTRTGVYFNFRPVDKKAPVTALAAGGNVTALPMFGWLTAFTPSLLVGHT